jgi:hypothetical protein
MKGVQFEECEVPNRGGESDRKKIVQRKGFVRSVEKRLEVNNLNMV